MDIPLNARKAALQVAVACGSHGDAVEAAAPFIAARVLRDAANDMRGHECESDYAALCRDQSIAYLEALAEFHEATQ